MAVLRSKRASTKPRRAANSPPGARRAVGDYDLNTFLVRADPPGAAAGDDGVAAPLSGRFRPPCSPMRDLPLLNPSKGGDPAFETAGNLANVG
jgi:hypothetical protein